MTRAVLSIGSNLGDRLGALQSVIDTLRDAVVAVSPVYETVPWGGVEQGPFLNAVLIADDPTLTPSGWLHRAQRIEEAAGRIREQHWGPRSLDVDIVSCSDGGTELVMSEPDLTLPHPYAHLRAFVLIPWLEIDPDARLTVADVPTAVTQLLDDIEPVEKAGVRLTDMTLVSRV
ncbi:MAG TPA: 2-amino-4-hydroxy-6-hydroxymethyldihydropteridine diphosphokinase [Mycobacterium sp.]|nr:2-amino-4-hydroxy-6-hydroxymethyldihydropteridine diphosphokinase [Mycobacterium sp.]